MPWLFTTTDKEETRDAKTKVFKGSLTEGWFLAMECPKQLGDGDVTEPGIAMGWLRYFFIAMGGGF